MELMRKTKGKNVIVSSGVMDVLELRGTFDVLNLCTLFTMNPNQARDSLSTYGRAAVLHGISRQQTYRGVLSFEKVEDLPESKKWKVQRGPTATDVHNKP
jgi:ribonuclease P/MRP protein subunit RPP1